MIDWWKGATITLAKKRHTPAKNIRRSFVNESIRHSRHGRRIFLAGVCLLPR